MTSGTPTHGCQIILVNDRAEVLLYLRDDKAWIPYPNTWCLPGGHLEDGETPLQCILREVHEEMGIRLAADDVQRDFFGGQALPGTGHQGGPGPAPGL